MNADGLRLHKLTPGRNTFQSGVAGPRWSPDGRRIAFITSRDGMYSEVSVMNADGTGVLNLTDDPAPDGEPAWSPDGRRIAFVSRRDGNPEIYVMNADGSGQTNLTLNPTSEHLPVWSPDGLEIAFESGGIAGGDRRGVRHERRRKPIGGT